MGKYENLKGKPAARFKSAVGINKETFEEMTEVLREGYKRRHNKHNGRHRKLSIEDMLLATLEYLREYRTYESIGASYGLSKQNIHKTIKWVEDELITSGLFSLPGKRKLMKPDTEYEVIIVDTTETPIERPKKGQKEYYSGKKNGTR